MVSIIIDTTDGLQIVQTEFGAAIAYTQICGLLSVGNRVLLNRTAKTLALGTGGYDFVIAQLDPPAQTQLLNDEHIVKLRYTPCQTAVAALESNPDNAAIWSKRLDGSPVVVAQLHSQIAHIAAAAAALEKRVVYIMTDAGSLVAPFSRLVRQLRAAGLLFATISTGQAVFGEYETVTVHSALLAAKHLLEADVIVVAQGPGNAGTATKYGFGGIEQASILDAAAALGGVPICAVRVSGTDPRERHRGVSHHTLTTMELVRSNCTIPFPAGMMYEGFETRHQLVEVRDLDLAFEILDRYNIVVTTMGRTSNQDPQFFLAAAAAGKYAAMIQG